MFHCIVEDEAREGGIVSCFDGCKPGGWDWVTGRGMVEPDERVEAGVVIYLVGLRGCHDEGLGRRCT